jgi:hypothetical protein
LTKEVFWNYSGIPKKKWRWYFEKYHWMTLELDESGLTYIGADMDCQSGGEYFGGFQTFDQLFEDGPIQEMPQEVTKEVMDFLKKHRKEGGAHLQLYYSYDLHGYHLKGVYIHLDDKPIQVKLVNAENRFLIYDGSISVGPHQFSFLFVLRSESDQKKADDEVTIKVQPGKNKAVLITRMNQDGTISTRLEYSK